MQTMTRQITLTGIKPTGPPHLGNYLGMIRPALALAEQYQALYFIADYHALTTIRDGDRLRRHVYEIAATWLVLGLDPDAVVFYRQSDVPEIAELMWVLACYAPKGLLNRAHAYKAAVDANDATGNAPDEGINVGLFNYPVLMAADILLFSADLVPVGLDQKQHLEIARDIAAAFNHTHGEVFTLPEPIITDKVATITGVDGRKMSKSYDNTLPLFAPPKMLRKQVMKIVTDSSTPDDPKDPDVCNIYNIYKHFAAPDDVAAVRERYLRGGLAYGTMKQQLFELLDATFSDARERYDTLLADTAALDVLLVNGAEKARELAAPLLRDVRASVGMRVSSKIL
jgi:tryptophanyl-tRNA synthetase